MNNDPKLDGAPILKETFCRIGAHMFIFTGTSDKETVPAFIKCNCGTYTYSEWLRIQELIATFEREKEE